MSHAELLEALQLFFALGDRLESVFYLDKQVSPGCQGNTAGGAVKSVVPRLCSSLEIALEMAGWLM